MGRSIGTPPLIFTLCTNWMWKVSLMPRLLYVWCHLGGPQSQSGCFGCLFLVGNQTWNASP